MTDDENRVPPFDGTNYADWKYLMEDWLEELGLLEVAQSDYRKAESKNDADLRELMKKDKKCRILLIQKLSGVWECASEKKTAYEIWSALNNTYARKGMAHRVQLRKKLASMKFDPSADTLEAHFEKFDKLIREMRTSGVALDETDVVCHLLITMPKSYEVVVADLESVSSDELSVTLAKERLLAYYEEKKKTPKPKISF